MSSHRHTRTRSAIALAAAIAASGSEAATLKGVTMPDSLRVGGTALVLNGLGVREATALKVKVYVMGLYLTERSGDKAAIVASTGPKHVVQQYVRDLAAKDLLGGWKESFARNSLDLAPVQAEYDKFLSYMTDIKKGEQIVIDFIEDRVETTVKGQKKDPIQSAAFQKALLLVWLGPNPPCASLQTGILGAAGR